MTTVMFKRSTVCEILFDNGITKVFRNLCSCRMQGNETMTLEVMTEEAGNHQYVVIDKTKVIYYTFVDECRYKPE